ncbi:putative reverse transcriptase domain-containing protein [Tanacetum coccineum]
MKSMKNGGTRIALTLLLPVLVEVRDFMRDGSLQLQARSQKYRKISSMTQRLRVWGSINVETQVSMGRLLWETRNKSCLLTFSYRKLGMGSIKLCNGILPKVMQMIFRHFQERDEREYQLLDQSVIYRGSSRAPIQIRETTNGGISIDGVTEAEVTSQEEMLSFLLCGSILRPLSQEHLTSGEAVRGEYVRPLWLMRLHSFKPIVDIDNDQEVHSSKFQELDFVMSDSEDSTVTYTEVSSPFEDLSDIGSPRVDGLPMMLEDPYVEVALQAPPSPNYVPGPEYPPSSVYVPYVPEPVYPEFMPPVDDVLPAEEQPLPATVSPTADSPGYITESDPEEDPEEDDEDPEEDLADYLDDRDDDEDEDEDEDEEEEEHPAPADFAPPPVHRVMARMSVRAQTPISLPLDTEILSPPLPISPPPLPASPTYHLGYIAAMIRLRAESPSTSHPLPLPSPIVLPYTRAFMAIMRVVVPSTYILAPRSGILPSETPPSGTSPLLPIPLPTPSPPLLLPSTVCRAGVSEVTLPPRKRLCIALGLRFEVSESSSALTARPTGGFRADYGFVGTLDDEIRRDPERVRPHNMDARRIAPAAQSQAPPTAQQLAANSSDTSHPSTQQRGITGVKARLIHRRGTK